MSRKRMVTRGARCKCALTRNQIERLWKPRIQIDRLMAEGDLRVEQKLVRRSESERPVQEFGSLWNTAVWKGGRRESARLRFAEVIADRMASQQKAPS